MQELVRPEVTDLCCVHRESVVTAEDDKAGEPVKNPLH
jgi:hypothetical protein